MPHFLVAQVAVALQLPWREGRLRGDSAPDKAQWGVGSVLLVKGISSALWLKVLFFFLAQSEKQAFKFRVL